MKERVKTPITLREKTLANGNKSLYLDIYHNGRRAYEFLHLYLQNEKNSANKSVTREQNKQTMLAAEMIKAQRYNELLSGASGMQNPYKAKILLIDYCSNYEKEFYKKGGVKASRFSMLNNSIKSYIGRKVVTLAMVDKYFIEGFIDYLTKAKGKKGVTLSQNTKALIINTFNAMLNIAVKRGDILRNPIKETTNKGQIKPKASKREYLTKDEVKRIMEKTYCRNEDIKKAFLFCCFCGLRYSDVRRLKWGDIKEENGKLSVQITMQKTKELLYLPLSAMAVNQLGEYTCDEMEVFKLGELTGVNKSLRRMAKQAEINKHISFHVSRHTFATLSLTSGADLYTTCKLLGHKDVKTTQIYAKIVDSKKVEAVDAISNLFE